MDGSRSCDLGIRVEQLPPCLLENIGHFSSLSGADVEVSAAASVHPSSTSQRMERNQDAKFTAEDV